MKKLKKGLFKFLIFSFFLLTLTACKRERELKHYLSGTDNDKAQLEFLFDTLKPLKSAESRYIINLQIYRILNRLKQNGKLNAFLLEQVNWYPEDPFNGYYLSIIAKDYLNRDMPKMAEFYYKRIIRDYPDLMSGDQSIHQLALTSLTQISSDPEETIYSCKQLLNKYNRTINQGPIYFTLAKNYEYLGQWKDAFSSWRSFLNTPLSGMQGEIHLRKEAQKLLKYYEYPNKNWTYTKLNDLVAAVKRAIITKNNYAIKASTAKVNFFAVSWAQEQTEADKKFLANLGTFMKRNITFKRNLDKNSNEKEAYWETNNWSYRIPTWYLYFRRIDFPADPEIHGKWEWAGIYFGEKPFKSSE